MLDSYTSSDPAFAGRTWLLQDVVKAALSHVKDMHPPNQQGGLAKSEAAREAELAGVILDDDVDSPMKVVKP